MIDLDKWERTTYKISEMKPFGKNPRQITKKGLQDLKKSLEKIGYIDEIALFSDGTIAGGHARYYILKDEQIENVPVKICREVLSPIEMDEIVIRLNKDIAGEWDFNVLANEFDDILLREWGFEKFEIPEIQGDKLINQVNKGDENSEWAQIGDFTKGPGYFQIIYHFKNEKAREEYVENNNIVIKNKSSSAWIVYVE